VASLRVQAVEAAARASVAITSHFDVVRDMGIPFHLVVRCQGCINLGRAFGRY